MSHTSGVIDPTEGAVGTLVYSQSVRTTDNNRDLGLGNPRLLTDEKHR